MYMLYYKKGMKMRNTVFTLVICFLIYLTFTQDSYAYLDPGTGSYLFQMIIAGKIGWLFAIKMFRRRILGFLKNIFTREKNEK